MTSKEEAKLENLVIKIFRESRNNYGTRKIKKQLERMNKGFTSKNRAHNEKVCPDI